MRSRPKRYACQLIASAPDFSQDGLRCPLRNRAAFAARSANSAIVVPESSNHRQLYVKAGFFPRRQTRESVCRRGYVKILDTQARPAPLVGPIQLGAQYRILTAAVPDRAGPATTEVRSEKKRPAFAGRVSCETVGELCLLQASPAHTQAQQPESHECQRTRLWNIGRIAGRIVRKTRRLATFADVQCNV